VTNQFKFYVCCFIILPTENIIVMLSISLEFISI